MANRSAIGTPGNDRMSGIASKAAAMCPACTSRARPSRTASSAADCQTYPLALGRRGGVMGLFRKLRKSLGYESSKLRERGIRGTAKVLSSERTMMSEESGGGRNVHIYKLRLLVTVPGSEPYEVTYRMS